ncbi:MAG TPA: nucleoside monophosphate kinase [Candidatus Paceibacterota bacterium]|nr:nucleoside monophosphate kinase [Candidatus Paceibacterota bacterium]
MEPIAVVFFGLSGSGKGTQAELLEKYLHARNAERGVVRPDMGNLARQFVSTGTPLAQKVNTVLASGGLMPSFMPIFLLTNDMNETFTGHEHVIFDGVARRPTQSHAIDDMMRFWDRSPDTLHAISLQLSEDSARARLKGRGRADDVREEVIASRFAWYKTDVVAAIDALRSRGWQVHDIDAEPDPHTIHANILAALKLV